ncbi:hypothetical protein HDU76_008849 [Blyttiomyces sp. JEL0837]|nr:hypothetical protein HDU76_008849 [Blyttiomyces sp. JEL0837]
MEEERKEREAERMLKKLEIEKSHEREMKKIDQPMPTGANQQAAAMVTDPTVKELELIIFGNQASDLQSWKSLSEDDRNIFGGDFNKWVDYEKKKAADKIDRFEQWRRILREHSSTDDPYVEVSTGLWRTWGAGVPGRPVHDFGVLEIEIGGEKSRSKPDNQTSVVAWLHAVGRLVLGYDDNDDPAKPNNDNSMKSDNDNSIGKGQNATS